MRPRRRSCHRFGRHTKSSPPPTPRPPSPICPSADKACSARTGRSTGASGGTSFRSVRSPFRTRRSGCRGVQASIVNLGAFQVSSNGLGAGNSFLEALAAGLYEVIERDAIACQQHATLHNGHIFPLFSEAELKSRPLVAHVLDLCDRADVRVVAYDSTADTNVPTHVAIAYDRTDHGVGLMKGSGAHLDPEIAALRAITEALQARLNFIAGSRDDIFRSAFSRARANWRPMREKLENAFDVNSPQARFGKSRAATTFEEDVHRLLANIRNAGLEHVVVFDLTPDGFPVHVIRVVVPGMEGYMHHGYRPGPRASAFAGKALS